MSSYEHPGQITWTDAREIYGEIAVTALEEIVEAFSVIPVATVGGGRDTNHEESINPDERKNGRASNLLHFKEVSVVGNPYLEGWKQLMDDDLDNNHETTEENICTSYVEPFENYHQSEFNARTWRYLLAERFYPESWTPGLREINGPNLLGTWGSVHPRHGFLYTEEDPKAGAVMAQRAIDVVTREDQPHIYNYDESILPSDEDTDRWAEVFPVNSDQCYTFGDVENFSFNRNTREGNYGWVYWARHECCTDMIGVILGVVKTSPICLE